MDEDWSQSHHSASVLGSQSKDQHTEPWTSPPRTQNARNGVRKRHSFFGRSSTDTATSRPAPPLKSTMSTPRDAGSQPAARPTTGMSGESRRRKTDPLDNLRQSMFGNRRKASVSNTVGQSSRASSRNEAGVEALPSLTHEQFATKEECMYGLRSFPRYILTIAPDHHHLRKQSISPPFHFEHVTHTG